MTHVNANMDANVDNSTSTLSVTIKPWADSDVTAEFVFSNSQIQSVVAQKPGSTVNIKAKLKEVNPRRVSFIGSLINQN